MEDFNWPGRLAIDLTTNKKKEEGLKEKSLLKEI